MSASCQKTKTSGRCARAQSVIFKWTGVAKSGVEAPDPTPKAQYVVFDVEHHVTIQFGLQTPCGRSTISSQMCSASCREPRRYEFSSKNLRAFHACKWRPHKGTLVSPSKPCLLTHGRCPAASAHAICSPACWHLRPWPSSLWTVRLACDPLGPLLWLAPTVVQAVMPASAGVVPAGSVASVHSHSGSTTATTTLMQAPVDPPRLLGGEADLQTAAPLPAALVGVTLSPAPRYLRRSCACSRS